MNRHILFVDDDVPLRETLTLFFRMRGIRVTSAENSEEANRLADQGGFSAAILDVDLGGESGLDLLDVFKRKYPGLPVIMFTALAHDPAITKDALARGASACICKGDSLETLMSGVERVLLSN